MPKKIPDYLSSHEFIGKTIENLYVDSGEILIQFTDGASLLVELTDEWDYLYGGGQVEVKRMKTYGALEPGDKKIEVL